MLKHALLAGVALSCATFVTTAHSQSADPETPLDPITVEGRTDGVENTTAGPVQGIRALTASSSTRTNTPIEKTPQTIQVIPRQLLGRAAEPPFDAGTPDRAPAEVARITRDMFSDFLKQAGDVGRAAFERSRQL